MRTFYLSILAALLLFVPNAAAHTYLDTTKPEDGTTITAPLQKIELTYSGNIEEGSTFIVKGASGSEFKPATVTVENGLMQGTFDEALPNDTYTVSWNSISEDGHPLSGQFSFTVNAPLDEVTEGNTLSEESTEPQVEAEQTETNEEDTQTNTATPLLIVGGLLLVIIVISLITLMKRKRK